MNHDEILAMEPGPVMNMTVALGIMGQVLWYRGDSAACYICLDSDDREVPAYWKRQSPGDVGPAVSVEGVDDYSRDYSAAWAVVAKMQGQEGYVTFELRHFPGNWICLFDIGKEYGKKVGYAHIKGEQVDAPEAICKAALLAVATDNEEKGK